MGDYSGTANFTYEIERYKNILTNSFHTEDEMYEATCHLDNQDTVMENNYKYECLELSIEGDSYFKGGRYCSLSGNNYPDEGETNINSVTGSDGKDWSNLLTTCEEDRIREMIEEGAHNNLYYEREPYDDDNEYI